MTWKAACGALLALGLGGASLSCSTHAAAVADAGAVPASVVADRVRGRDAGIGSMAARGSVSFETPDRAGSAFFDLALRKPDSLLLTFRGPFGIGAGFLFLSRERYVMYNSFDNRVRSGVPSASALRMVIPVDLTTDEVMGAFTGGFPLPAGAPDRYTVEDGQYLLEYRVEGRTESFWIDPAYDLVAKYRVSDASGSVLFEAQSSQFVTQGDLAAPRHVTVDFPDQGRHISIHYSSLDLNADDLSFLYTVPAGARAPAQ